MKIALIFSHYWWGKQHKNTKRLLTNKHLNSQKQLYISKTTFILYALTRQLTAEQYLDEKTEDLLIENRKLRHKLTLLESDNSKMSENYYEVLNDLRNLRIEKRHLEQDTKKA